MGSLSPQGLKLFAVNMFTTTIQAILVEGLFDKKQEQGLKAMGIDKKPEMIFYSHLSKLFYNLAHKKARYKRSNSIETSNLVLAQLLIE